MKSASCARALRPTAKLVVIQALVRRPVENLAYLYQTGGVVLVGYAAFVVVVVGSAGWSLGGEIYDHPQGPGEPVQPEPDFSFSRCCTHVHQAG